MKRRQSVLRQKGHLTTCTCKDNKHVHMLTTMPTTTACSAITRSVKEREVVAKGSAETFSYWTVQSVHGWCWSGWPKGPKLPAQYQDLGMVHAVVFSPFGGCHHGCISAWAKKPSPQRSSDNKVLSHACIQPWTYWQMHWRKSLQKKKTRKSATSSWRKKVQPSTGPLPCFTTEPIGNFNVVVTTYRH